MKLILKILVVIFIFLLFGTLCTFILGIIYDAYSLFYAYLIVSIHNIVVIIAYSLLLNLKKYNFTEKFVKWLNRKTINLHESNLKKLIPLKVEYEFLPGILNYNQVTSKSNKLYKIKVNSVSEIIKVEKSFLLFKGKFANLPFATVRFETEEQEKLIERWLDENKKDFMIWDRSKLLGENI